MKLLTETGVRRLVKKIAEGADKRRPLPEITFVDHHISHTHEGGITISSPAWVEEYRAGDAKTYRLLVLHEMAHWLTGIEGHTVWFYFTLFSLCKDYGVPVDFAYEDEVQYRPRPVKAWLKAVA